MYKTRTLKSFSKWILAATVGLFLLPSHARADERVRRLGKDTLRESVKTFRIHYPKAVCGSLTSLDINPKTLRPSGNLNEVHCCLNDKASLTEFSRFPILNLDDCAVHASFWKNRLSNLTFMVDIRSVQVVLTSFKRRYGPPAQMMTDPEDDTKLTMVDWIDGEATLELRLSRMGCDVSKEYCDGEPWLEAVVINLWESFPGD